MKEDKTIINISSTASEIKHINYQMGFYPIHKKALDEACMRLQHIEKNCRIVNVKIGWMDTPMSEDFVEEKLETKVVADKIMYIMENKDITSMTIDGGFKKWKY
jgi:NAD(P)-dependent dehydrogenase (short-subunit alcohol dehydrogenase family)